MELPLTPSASRPCSLQEVDPTPEASDMEQLEWAQDGFLTELAGSIPGIDEAMSFAEVMKQARKQKHSQHYWPASPPYPAAAAAAAAGGGKGNQCCLQI